MSPKNRKFDSPIKSPGRNSKKSNSPSKSPSKQDVGKNYSRSPETYKNEKNRKSRFDKRDKNVENLRDRSRSTSSEYSKEKKKSKKPSTEQTKLPERRFSRSDSKTNRQIPVVRLRSSSDERISENDQDNVDIEREQEINTLKLLKSDLTAKAKEVLEKKIPKKTNMEPPRITENKDHFDIPTFTKSTSPSELLDSATYKMDLSSIKLVPLKKPLMTFEVKKDKVDSPKIDHDEFDIKGKDFVKNDAKEVLDKVDSKREGRSAVKIEGIKRNASLSSSQSRSRSRTRDKSPSKDRKSRSSSRSSYR